MTITFIYGPKDSGKTLLANALRCEFAAQERSVPPIVESQTNGGIKKAIIEAHNNDNTELVIVVNGPVPDFHAYKLVNDGKGGVLESDVCIVQTVGRIA